LAALLAFLGVATARAQDMAVEPPSVAVAIERLLESGRLPALGEPNLRDAAPDLRRLYPSEAPLPLWSGTAGASAAAVAAIDQLASAADFGMNPESYAATELRAKLGAPRGAWSAADRAWFDVAVSAALLRFCADLHGGRVAPGARAFDAAGSPPRLLDRVDVVRALAAGADAGAALAALEPPLSLYRDLKKALRRYRELTAPAAALPPLGELGILRPGEVATDLRGLRALLGLLGDLAPGEVDAAAADVYDPPLVEAVRRFQVRHGLDPDGVVGAQTKRALTVPLARRVAQIEWNLERLRWLPRAIGPVLIVNIPEFRLRAFVDLAVEPVLDMKVIVGSADRKHDTVAFAAEMRGVAFWPHWNVPRSITQREQLPRIQRDPAYLTRQNMEIVVPSASGASRVMGASPEAVEALRSGRARLRQRPGSRNALGRVKFLMPNRYDIYLHDTPSVGLFARSRRDFSHGCVRVEKATDLAVFVLAGLDGWDRGRIEAAVAAQRTRHVTLPRPIPVWLTYLTALASADGTVSFFADLYDRDDALARNLR
jgi:murein L,D-transpeptidase YcbB/YkuD